jgi:hypothetical protein
MTNREFFLQRWEQEHPLFLKVFQALPHEKADFRPHPRSRSAAELVTLIDTLQVHWKETAPTLNLEEMIAAYQKAHEEVAWRLKKLDDKAWEQNSKLLTESGAAYEDTLGGMFWAVLFDGVHHRGQLTTYIRLMGGKVPAIYGPSADDPGQ